MLNRAKSEASTSLRLGGELVYGSEARYPSASVGKDDGLALKFREPYPGRSLGLRDADSGESGIQKERKDR